ncbi:MAG TPA: hypothetical protein OIM45_08105 [Clostridiaceae bacterium]|nr:hypothetical protein [Clostridiaceae bacterium]
MEEIKVGNYVRTKKKGIFKVLSKKKTAYGYLCGTTDNDNIPTFTVGKGGSAEIKNDIVKHSSNIKDLVQAGDIIIYTINCKIADIDIVKEHTDARTLEKSLRVGLWSLEQVNIKQILTKEKFESESYRLEE